MDMRKDNKPDVTHRGPYALISLITLAVLSVMGFSFYSSHVMINTYAPQVNAAMEVKLEATFAHLWFEEIISGDRYENIEDIIGHIDQAKWYARAMLDGGENAEGVFPPLDDPVLRNAVRETLVLITEFEKITRMRWEALTPSGIGTRIDQEYDSLFKTFIAQIDNVETLIQQKTREDYQRYLVLQGGLVLFILLLSCGAFLVRYRHGRERAAAIRKLHKAKEVAEKSEQWLKTTMNSMGDGVIITDGQGRVTYMNPVASTLTGWPLEDAVDRKVTEVMNLVDETDKTPVENPVMRVIARGRPVWLGDHVELISRHGRVWPISDSAAPIFDRENHLVGVVVVFRDIEERKQAEAERASLEAQLRQSFKMEAIGTMAGGIAHDFNNILAMVLGNTEMAMDDISEKHRARHNLDEIYKAATRAKKLVRQILSFSRQEKNEQEPHNLCRVVAGTMKSLHTTIPASVEQRLEIPGLSDRQYPDHLTIMADTTQIHQLLLNLCVNAVQAMEEKGTLTVRVSEHIVGNRGNLLNTGLAPGHYGYLSVSDSGPGIADELLEKIFDPFFTTKDVGHGTGMGLAVVHGIVKEHGGRILAENREAGGVVFHVYFPLTEKRRDLLPDDAEDMPTGSEHILFVDDEEMLASMGGEMIRRLGYKVTAKTVSADAFDLFLEDPDAVDMVITDQTMPGLTGAELARQLLDIRPDLPIVLCTGYSSKVDRAKARDLGVRAFAAKPLKRKQMARMIRQLLDGKKNV